MLDAVSRGFAALEGARILVHGGGKRASQVGSALGHSPRLVDGRRITDQGTLEVVTMVYAGWANKTLVARLQSLGCNALGLSGADADLIRAAKRPAGEIDYGYVGDVQQVAAERLIGILRAGFVPVFCALTHDGAGQLLNTNADTVAAEIAAALAGDYQVRLCYLFEKPGVLQHPEDPGSVIPDLNRARVAELRQEGKIAAGMIPKLDNAFRALEQGVDEVWIGPPALLTEKGITFTKLRL